MNVTSPWSRRRSTEPASVTVSPTSAARSSPAVCVRSISLVPRVREERALAGRAGLMIVRVRRRPPEGGLRIFRHVTTDLGDHRCEPGHALLLLDQVADDEVAPARFRGATDHRHARAVLDRTLELPLERA